MCIFKIGIFSKTPRNAHFEPLFEKVVKVVVFCGRVGLGVVKRLFGGHLEARSPNKKHQQKIPQKCPNFDKLIAPKYFADKEACKLKRQILS